MFLQNDITTEQREALINHFGKKKFERVVQLVEKYRVIWSLTHISLIDYFSVNILFNTTLANGSQTVLKVHGQVDRYTTREIMMLKQHLPHYCTLLHYNEEDGVLLLEKCEGVSLHHITNLNDRLAVFMDVYKSLYHAVESAHCNIQQQHIYPTYLELLQRIRIWALDCTINGLLDYIDEAIHFYKELSNIYNEKVLLHGDLHHDNIIYSPNKTSTIIDPKGVIDSPIYDLPRFILNELEKEVIQTDVRKIVNVINYFSEQLNLPYEHIAKLFCIESILSITWTLQDSDEAVNDDYYLQQHRFCREFVFRS